MGMLLDNTSLRCGPLLRMTSELLSFIVIGFKVDFLQAVRDKQIRVLRALHFFDVAAGTRAAHSTRVAGEPLEREHRGP